MQAGGCAGGGWGGGERGPAGWAAAPVHAGARSQAHPSPVATPRSQASAAPGAPPPFNPSLRPTLAPASHLTLPLLVAPHCQEVWAEVHARHLRARERLQQRAARQPCRAAQVDDAADAAWRRARLGHQLLHSRAIAGAQLVVAVGAIVLVGGVHHAGVHRLRGQRHLQRGIPRQVALAGAGRGRGRAAGPCCCSLRHARGLPVLAD
jgi:hypothetical protein